MLAAVEQPVVETRIWCDASVDPVANLAFGAYMVKGMKRPVVVKLKEKRSFDAEVEIMTKAALRFPHGSIVMTDLQHLQQGLAKWNYHLLARFKEVVSSRNCLVEYCKPEHRPTIYAMCHRAAYGRLQMER